MTDSTGERSGPSSWRKLFRRSPSTESDSTGATDPPVEATGIDQSGWRSPYLARRGSSREGRQSLGSLTIHWILFLLAVTWLLDRAADSGWQSGVHVALALSSVWLLVGPALVVKWEWNRQRLIDGLLGSGDLGADVNASVAERSRKYRPFSVALLPVPVVLIISADLAGGRFITDTVGLPRSGPTGWAAVLILGVGGLAAGFGLAGAFRTIVLAACLTSLPGRFSPFAGVASLVAQCVAGFAFSSAVYFGLGGSVMLPGVTAGIIGSTGVARAALVCAVVLIIAGTVALLAAPAAFLSRRYMEERDSYLGQLSDEIDKFVGLAADPTSRFSDQEYVRLRSLLEIRTHVVQHSTAQPSVEMVKQIPLAVMVPVASTAAAWLTVLVR